MLGYRDFSCEVTERMQKMLGDGFEISVCELEHNNGVKTDSLVVLEESSSISECIALKHYYELYRKQADLDVIMDDILKTYRRARAEKHEIHENELADWDTAKEKIMFRLVSSEANHESLKDMPHRDICNLSQVFYVMLKADGGCRTVAVNNGLMKLWGVGADEILKYAEKNTPEKLPVKFARIDEFIAEESAEDVLCSTEIPFYVLSNSMKMYGAGCILYDGILERISGKLGCSFYILPSSLHEVLLVPSRSFNSETAEQLKKMVIDVNFAELSEQDILSDSVYFYNKEEKHISIAA